MHNYTKTQIKHIIVNTCNSPFQYYNGKNSIMIILNSYLIVFFFLITDFIALIAVNNLLDIQLLPSIPSC
jgi:hypothetical protein